MLPTAVPLDAAACAAIPGWFPPPIGLAGLKAKYGKITVANGIVVPETWESSNMEMLKAVAPGVSRLYVNRYVAPILRAAIDACLALNDGYVIRTLGCFAPRPKRVNGDLSTHSWGIAIDLNASTNPLQPPPSPGTGAEVKRDIPDAWIAEFEKRGFTWGGRFPKPDPMHLQYVRGY